jgi:hypothetical protein
MSPIIALQRPFMSKNLPSAIKITLRYSTLDYIRSRELATKKVSRHVLMKTIGDSHA